MYGAIESFLLPQCIWRKKYNYKWHTKSSYHKQQEVEKKVAVFVAIRYNVQDSNTYSDVF